MNQDNLDRALAEYGRAIDRNLAPGTDDGEPGGTIPLGYLPENPRPPSDTIHQQAERLRRTWRIRRTGSVLVPVFAALALGLHLWANDVTARTGEERALATLYLLADPAVPDDVWDDLLLIDPEEEP